MTRVLIAAPSAITRAGLEALVAGTPAITVVGSATGTVTLMQQMDDLQPDVLLLALERSPDDALPAALLALAAGPPACPILLLLEDLPVLWAAEALRFGVRAILTRAATAAEIVAAIAAVAAGLVVLHPEVLDALAPAPSSTARAEPLAHGPALTPREIEILGMLAEGLGNKTIAGRLGISEHTVKFHIGAIFAKLGASSRTEAVTLGIRQGLIML